MRRMNPCAMWIALLKLLIGIIRKKIHRITYLGVGLFMGRGEVLSEGKEGGGGGGGGRIAGGSAVLTRS